MTRGLGAENQGGYVVEPPTSASGGGLDLTYYKQLLRGNWRTIAASVVVLFLFALIYVLVATPKYTATAALMIDTRKNQLLEAQQVVGDQAFDTSGVESQVEVLKSESVALVVIRQLKLADNPDFMKRGVLSKFMPSALFASSEVPTAYERERSAVDVFARNLTVKRIGLTYVITLDFTTNSSALAAQIANAIVGTYLDNEINARYQSTNRANNWLEDRIKQLRAQASTAEHEVQKFRSDNTIVDTGRGLLSEQQIADVSSQLVLVRAATSEAKAKLDRIDAISKMDLPDDTVTDALKNDVITRLRAQYLDLSGRAADWASRYGEKHQATIHLREQMAQIKLSIRDEIRRIAETYKSDYNISQAREKALQDNLSQLVSAAGAEGQTSVKLHDLESQSQSYRNLYDSFLQKFMESAQQKTFPTTDARLITAATPPTSKSSPKPALVIPASLVFGLLIGSIIAIGRDRADTAFRSVAQVESVTGVDCLGFLPKVKAGNLQLAGAADDPTAWQNPRSVETRLYAYRYVLIAPFSRFAETIRSIKVAIDVAGLSRSTKIVGIVSALSHEGKSVTAANLAHLIAKTQKQVLLLDCDLRNPSLSAALTPRAEKGMLQILDETATFDEVVCRDEETGLDFVPAVLNSRVPHTAEILSSQRMAAFLEWANEYYNYIVVDLPPMASVVDVRAMGRLIDGFVHVVEWGKTSRDTVVDTLKATQVVRGKMIGIVLNKASEAALKRVEASSKTYHSNYYFDGHKPT